MGRLAWLVAGLVWAASAGAESYPQAHSLAGKPLFPPPLSESVRADREAKLAEAREQRRQDPNDADAVIWVGRRLAYLGDYQAAIALFSEGVLLHPKDPRMLRHRGHRYITTRQFDRAIADLTLAARMVEGQADQVEPDGLPNARGIPTSTLQGNIHYHLGLALYLQGRFDEAVDVYRDCLETATNPDMESAARYWLYLASKRAGRDDAETVLEAVRADWDIIENRSYHRLLLLYRGDLELSELEPGDDGIQNATLGYGLAMTHFIQGNSSRWLMELDRLLEGEQWAAFGHLAAEADWFRENAD